jgi:2-succinyl-5-enolpyruvyl-6-hydroxy-3-cyclohexene-1-carboxylate synthase
MIPPNATYAQIGALVDELVRCGMRRAVTSPGSRNAPVTLTLVGDERIETTSVIDERAAGFMALGMAKATGLPVAVTCTSGTAAANLLPAVVEAHEARVPLIVLTADRPPELRDVGAGQAIDQIGIYGRFAKWFVELGNGEPGRDWAIHVRALACRAFWTAAGGRPGPVHLNLPLREPLAPVADAGFDAGVWAGRPLGAPWTAVHRRLPLADPALLDALAARIAAMPRGAIVCGPNHEAVAEPVTRLAAAAGWPVLAEPCSGSRCGSHDLGNVVAHYDALLRCDAFAEARVPELVLRVGDMPTSKPLRAWVARADVQVLVDPHGTWHEPTRLAGEIVQAAAAPTCAALADALEAGAGSGPDRDWMREWRIADDRVTPLLRAEADPFEPRAYTAIAAALPDEALVWVGSSMAIRDVETFFPRLAKRVRLLSSRGANGIDGVIAAAAGAALATGAPTWLLIGDVGLQHDIGGLLAAAGAGADLRIVCVANGGGGIFDFLPVAQQAERHAYERHIATPPTIELAAAAALAGMRHTTAVTVEEIRAAAAEPGIVEVRTDRADNVARHRQLLAAVASAVGEPG